MDDFRRSIKTGDTVHPITAVKRSGPVPTSVEALTNCPHPILSSECSSIAHHPTTRTIVKQTTITPTTTVTVTSCTAFDYDFVIATIAVPSKTFTSSGAKMKTLQVTVKTVPYYCYSYGVGCVTAVPKPCCPGTCTDIGVGYPLCIPTVPAEASSYTSSLFGE